MAIIRSGQPDSMGHIDTTQREFRDQVDDVADELLQLAGVAESGTATSDPLSAPYVLYVDANIGDDAFVSGVYSAGDTVERRIAMQKLTCGYTQARPFKTINRAAIEAAIITSGTWFDGNQAQRDRQLVSIVVAPGEYIVENGAGVASPTIADPSAPTAAELRGYNDATGGVILPRGCSLVSLDLRKTIIRPAFVPARGTEGSNYGNRRAIFKVTGTGYYYGFTFKDHLTTTTSHHLLSCFEFTPRAQLNIFYAKVMNTFGTNWDLDTTDEGTAREYEYEIVGEQPATPVPATDTVGSASPYIYNISVRSVYGLCGVFANGTSADGFRSMVIAQFTGVSLQKDFRCWQVYSGGAWATATSEQQIITAGPDNVRMNPEQRSFHIRAVNKAVIQEVSVFAIGQGIHHWVESGGELTITNSNSNFGGCAALAEGYRDEPGPSDGAWEPQSYKVALSPFAKTASVTKIVLGTVNQSNDSATNIPLDDNLEESTVIPDQPAILTRDGYTLKEDDLVWIENSAGDDYYAELAATPWNGSNTISVQAAFTNGTGAPGAGGRPSIDNARMYVRRFVDTRTVEERTYTVKLEGPAANRITPRNYVLQDATTDWADTRLSMVADATLDRAGNDTTMDVELRNRNVIAAHATGTYYRKGDCITRNNKCLQAIVDNYGTFDADDWIESYVHMESGFDPESPITNAHPILIFDGDTLDGGSPSATCGFAIGDAIVEAQYESATDYKGLSNYSTNDGLGLNLTPAASADARTTAITGAGNVEMRRPSNIRLFGHAFEWAGFGNYSKALPQYQGDLSAANKFTYYFTNEDGGRVYVSGFNEEGFAVTAQGLIDLETGEVRRAVDIGSPDIQFPEIPTTATTQNEGLVELESAGSIPNLTAAERTALNNAINGSPAAITEPYLSKYLEEQGYVVSPAETPAVILHVCGNAANVQTGNNSIPYGYPTGTSAWTANGTPFQSSIFTSVTDAVRAAERILTPVGAMIVISVHDEMEDTSGNPIIEDGPLQLLNGTNKFVIAGCRAAGQNPAIHLRRLTTVNACARLPQYSSVWAFSAGAIFADIEVNANCNNVGGPLVLTIDGGFGIGIRDLDINWSNVGGRVVSGTTTAGGTLTVQYYNQEQGTNRNWTHNVVGGNAVGNVVVFGSDKESSGLVSHNGKLLWDFRSSQIGNAAGRPTFTLNFNHTATTTPEIQFLALGARGGVVVGGGRVDPTVKYNFNSRNWNIASWIDEDFCKRQNYMGPMFQTEAPAGANPSTGWNAAFETGGYGMNATTLGTLTANQATLDRGCCIDMDNDTDRHAGPFGLLLELEDTESATYIRANNDLGSYCYGYASGAANRTQKNRNLGFTTDAGPLSTD